MTARPRVKLLAIAALLLMLAQGTVGSPRVGASSFVDEVIHLINMQRHTIKGPRCPALVPNAGLMAVAQRHADDMAVHHYVSHASLDNASPWQRIAVTGYTARRTAENIAAGQRSPHEVIVAWMGSPAHRANILDCQLHEVGVGFSNINGSDFGSYWVTDFASR